MIPVLGITVANTKICLFDKLIKSIDYPIDVVSILCNNSNFDYFLEIKKLCCNSLVKNFIISYCPYNLGCAGGWNYHIKNNPLANYWLLSNDDIIYGNDDLLKFHQSSMNHDITFNRFLISSGGKYSLFSLNKKCVDTVGLFDENFYPAYYEDDDYDRRISRYKLSTNYVEINAIHAHEGTMKNLEQSKYEYIRNILWEKNKNYFLSKVKNDDFSVGVFSLDEKKEKIFKL